MNIQVTIDGETHEVELSSVQLPENHEIISPDNANSKGYYTQPQVENTVKSRLKKRDENLKKELIDDEDFGKEVLSRFNISLDDNGKPKGLKSDFDPEEWKSKKAKELTEPLEKEVEKERKEKSQFQQKLLEQSILSATKGLWKEDYTKYQDDGRVKPIVVNQYKDLFRFDDKGEPALWDDEIEGFATNPKGQHIRPNEYLTDPEKYGSYMVDKRQLGSDFQGGSKVNGKPIFTEAEIDKMSEAEFDKHEDEIMAAAADGRVQKN